MALTITISGTAEEIIAHGKVLEKGMRPKRVPSEKRAQLKLENEYLALIVNQNLIAAIKVCREKNFMTGDLGTLKGAKDHLEALRGRAIMDGRLLCDNTSMYPSYTFGPAYKA